MKNRRISRGALINISLALTLVVVVVFGFFYLRRQPPAPVEQVTVTARKVLNQPPTNLRNIYGPASSPLRAPLGLAVAPDGRVFVADSDNNQVQVFDANGKWLAKWGKLGRKEGEFYYPVNILIRNNQVYVADLFNSRIQIFDLKGKYLGVIPDPAKHKDLEIGPQAMAQDKDGNLYVATLGHNVMVFDKDDKFVRTVGRPGQGPGELEYPFGVVVDGQNLLWVSDSNNGRVHRYERDGKLNLTFGGLVLPRGLAADDQGRVYIVDTLQHKVFAVDKDGKQLFTFGERGVEEGQFNFPNAVAVGPNGRVYVVDRENNRVAVWGY